MEDGELIARVKNNDRQAFKVLFDTYRPKVYKTAFLILKDYEYADEVVQETFIQVFLKIHKLTNPIAFEKWLYKIAVNLCFEIIRKNKKSKIVSLNEENSKELDNSTTDIFLPDNIVIQKEIQDKIMKCIDSLQVKHRTVLILFYFNNFSVKEISDIVNCSEGTVKSRLFYGKKLLKEDLLTNHNDIVNESMGGMFYEF